MSQHGKVGKCMKKDVQSREKVIDDMEAQLVAEAMKMPNRTHPDSPIGGENNNKVIRVVESKSKFP